MKNFTFPFEFSPTTQENLKGALTLSPAKKGKKTAVRKGSIESKETDLPVFFYSNRATQKFIYLHPGRLTRPLAKLLDVKMSGSTAKMNLPGQLVLGGEREKLVAEAVHGVLATAELKRTIQQYDQNEIAVLPILREGVKYGIAGGLFSNFHYYCDEIVVDAHHVVDTTVSGYGRRVDITAFKDADLTDEQRSKIKMVFLGDSIAGGVVVVGLLHELPKRFPNLERIEIIAPLATLFGCARIATHLPAKVAVRIHIFETILNGQAPEYYWSPHYPQLEMHMQPQLQKKYRTWWGQDDAGKWIADTACAGYGWSEAFFHPAKQIRMMNEQLMSRNTMKISTIIERRM